MSGAWGRGGGIPPRFCVSGWNIWRRSVFCTYFQHIQLNWFLMQLSVTDHGLSNISNYMIMGVRTWLSCFSGNAITKDHSPRGKTTERYFLTILEAGSLRSRWGQGWFLLRSLFLMCSCCLLPVSSLGPPSVYICILIYSSSFFFFWILIPM